MCDAYDAMVSDRPYRARIAPAEALQELRRCSGSQFDPAVVAAFLAEVLPPDLSGLSDPDLDATRA